MIEKFKQLKLQLEAYGKKVNKGNLAAQIYIRDVNFLLENLKMVENIVRIYDGYDVAIIDEHREIIESYTKQIF